MAFYDDMAATASRLLAKFGSAQTLRRTTSTLDPVTGTVTESTEDLETTGLFQSIRQELIDGSRIQSGDRMIVLDNSRAPEMSDKLKIGSEFWSIVDIRPVNPAGTALVYFIQLRK